jgi:hypothetical protein
MKVGPDVDGQLSINEIMSLNALTTKDENGEIKLAGEAIIAL